MFFWHISWVLCKCPLVSSPSPFSSATFASLQPLMRIQTNSLAHFFHTPFFFFLIGRSWFFCPSNTPLHLRYFLLLSCYWEHTQSFIRPSVIFPWNVWMVFRRCTWCGGQRCPFCTAIILIDCSGPCVVLWTCQDWKDFRGPAMSQEFQVAKRQN